MKIKWQQWGTGIRKNFRSFFMYMFIICAISSTTNIPVTKVNGWMPWIFLTVAGMILMTGLLGGRKR